MKYVYKKGISWALSLLFIAFCFLPKASFAETDVTDKTETIKSRLMYDRSTKTSYLNVSIRNISQDALLTPIKLVITDISDPSVVVANPDGVNVDGKPYYIYEKTNRNLMPQELLPSKIIKFKNLARVRFNYNLKVMSCGYVKGHVETSPNTKIVSTSVIEHYLQSVGSDYSSFEFSTDIQQEINIQVGDILVFSVSEMTPKGALRKVDDVSTNNNLIILTTSQAEITDAIKNCYIEIKNSLSPGKVAGADLADGVLFTHNSPFNLTFTDSIGDSTSSSLTLYSQGGVEAKVDGNVSVEDEIYLLIVINEWKMQELLFTNTATESSGLNFTVTGEASFSKEKILADFDLGSITCYVPIGMVPFPVILTPELSILLGAKGSVEAEVIAGIDQGTSMCVGAQFKNNVWAPVNTFSDNFNYTEPSVSGSASLKGYVSPRVDLLLYSVTGPFADIESYLQLSAEIGTSPCWKLSAGLEVDVGVLFEILDNELANLEYNGLVDLNKPLASGDCPEQDVDEDGIYDSEDNCPNDYNPDQADFDGDGKGDICDEDDDGDNVPDDQDDFPYDPTEWKDTDGDGVGDNSDAFPNDPDEWEDTDNDGTGNNADPDDDNDGVDDANDACPNTPIGAIIDADGCSKDQSGTTGDPHFYSFDGLVYHNQSIGEFVLIREDKENGIEIQIRQGRLSGRSPCVTFNKAVALRLDNNVIEYRASTDEILLDGSILDLAQNQDYITANGTFIKRINGIVCEDSLNKVTISINDRGAYLNILPMASRSLKGKLSGLLGSFDDNMDNDQLLRDGSIPESSIAFMNDWRLSDEESLFVYGPNQNTHTFTDTQTCGIKLTDEDKEYARQLYTSLYGEGTCDEPMIISIATDHAAGLPEEEIIYWVSNIQDYVTPTGTLWYQDNDNDGYGSNSETIISCSKPEGYVENNLDCDDSDDAINPNAIEIPGNEIDENCDGIKIFSENIINLNGRSSAYTNMSLTAGSYKVIPIGTSEGGTYVAWSAWSYGDKWLNTYRILSEELGTIVINDSTRYSSPSTALNNSETITFELTYDSIVSFYIADSPYYDNRGGISLRVEKIESNYQ